MLTYIYAGEIFCEKCGRAIREKLKNEEKAPVFPDNPWSYDSKDYPKGPYYFNERGHGLFSCTRCGTSLGPLKSSVLPLVEGKITDPWTDPLMDPGKRDW